MPVQCPITFPRLSEDDMREIDFAVMGHAFATQRKLGRLCDESVYQGELLGRLQNAGMEALIEIPVTLSHRQFSIRLELDLVVDQRVIYELKTAAALTAAHEAQLLGYLFMTNSTRGKLINFRPQSVASRFVNTTLDDAERRRYSLNLSKFSGDDRLAVLIRPECREHRRLPEAAGRQPALAVTLAQCHSPPSHPLHDKTRQEDLTTGRFDDRKIPFQISFPIFLSHNFPVEISR